MEFADGMLIGGELSGGSTGAKLSVENPATGKIVGEAPAANALDVDNAVNSARACFEGRAWTSRLATERAAAMWRLSDAIMADAENFAKLEVIDNGMPLAFARATISSAINGLRYYAGLCTKVHGLTSDVSGGGREMHAYTLMEPVGVVGAITPWNAPLAAVVHKIAPAIAAGCSIVVKPAEQTPLSALRLAQLLAKSDLPSGLVNIVTGVGGVAGAALANHPLVDKLTFTGSTEVGKSLVHASAGNLKRLTLELGGKSPVFVFDDADMSKTIPACLMAIFANSGQACFAGSRLYVQRKRYTEVVERISAAAKTMKLGSGLEESTQLGPLISAKQMKRVLDYVESGIAEGAELMCGGRQSGEEGYFVEPTVLANTERRDIRIAREEIFGPVLTAMPFDDIEELGPLANDTNYGLGSGIFTSNVSTAHRAARHIRAGNVWINCYGVLDKSMPFGGYRQSGWGRENGLQGIEPFLETKSVYTML